MEARSSFSEETGSTHEDPPSPPQRHSGIRMLEVGSGAKIDASECPTIPPPGPARPGSEAPEVLITRVHLHTTMDEILYRLAVGDWDGAWRANEELESFVPHIIAARVVLAATPLDSLQEFILAYVDGLSTWGEIVEGAPFEATDTLKALCLLVDQGIIGGF
jgi:hypothetical protein